MTVCIGVISRPMIIVATDRMITSGDIQFEQQQPKIFNIAHNTLALISGDIAVQTALVDSTRAAVQATGIKTVQGVAKVYADEYANYCQRKAESAVLKPLGLDSVDALMKRKWPAAVVDELLRQVQYAADGDDVATIIAGQDESGQHLCVINQPGIYTVHDRIGFASVGIGQRHAESQFMFAGYTPQWAFPKALYLTYIAKKHAEVAPGVGQYTDLAVITSGPSANIVVLDPFVGELKSAYDAELHAMGPARQSSENYVDEALRHFLSIPPPTVQPNPALNLSTASTISVPSPADPQAPSVPKGG